MANGRKNSTRRNGGGNARPPTAAEVRRAFRLLARAANTYGLPKKDGSYFRPGEWSAADFMLMDVVGIGTTAVYRFKHQATRNYLLLYANGRIVVPTGGAFMQGYYGNPRRNGAALVAFVAPHLAAEGVAQARRAKARVGRVRRGKQGIVRAGWENLKDTAALPFRVAGRAIGAYAARPPEQIAEDVTALATRRRAKANPPRRRNHHLRPGDRVILTSARRGQFLYGVRGTVTHAYARDLYRVAWDDGTVHPRIDGALLRRES
jgi:hypothetical protein